MEAGLFGRVEDWPRRDLIGYSEEFDATVALAAYRQGVFPMPLDPRAMGWWSPMYRSRLLVEWSRPRSQPTNQPKALSRPSKHPRKR